VRNRWDGLSPLMMIVILVFGQVSEAASSVAGTPYDVSNGAYSYMPMNFNDVPSALVVLLGLLVVNNWFVYCDQFVAASGSELARLYFVSWWVLGVCVLLNVLVSVVLEVSVAAFQHHHDRMLRNDATHVRQVSAASLHAVDSITQDSAAVSAVMDDHHRPVLLKVKGLAGI